MDPMLWIAAGVLLICPFVHPTIFNQEEENHLPFAQIKETEESGPIVAEYVWSVRNVRQLLLSTTDDAFIGPEFYTGRPGYKIRLSLTSGQVNPVDGLSYLGLWFTLAPGLYDEILEWPFPYTLNLTLLDRRKHGRKLTEYQVDEHENPVSVPLRPQLNSKQTDAGFPNYGLQSAEISNAGHPEPDVSDQESTISRSQTDPRSPNNQIQDSTFPKHPLPDPDFSRQGIPTSEFQTSERPNGRIHESQFLDPASRNRDTGHQDSGYLNPRRRESGFRKQGNFESGLSNIGPRNQRVSVFPDSASSRVENQEPSFSHAELKTKGNMGYSLQYPTLMRQVPSDSRNAKPPFSNTRLADHKTLESLSPNHPLADSTILNFGSLSHGHQNSKSPNNHNQDPEISRGHPNPSDGQIQNAGSSFSHMHHGPSRLTDTNIEESDVSLGHNNQDSRLPDDQINARDSPSQILHSPSRVTDIQEAGDSLGNGNQDSRSPDGQINPLPSPGLPDGSFPDVDRSIHLTINPTSALCRLRKQFLRPRNKRRGGGCGKGFFIPLDRLQEFVSEDEILLRATIFLQTRRTPSPKSARVLMRGHQLVSEFLWNVSSLLHYSNSSTVNIIPTDDYVVLIEQNHENHELNEPSSEKGRVSSDIFYVNSESYLMVLRMSFGSPDDVGLFVTLVPGEFDDALQWPFSYSFELSVADSSGNERRISVDPTSGTCPLQAFTRPRHRPNPPCGFRKLAGLARNGSLAVKFTAVLDQMPHFAKLAVREGFLVAEYVWRVPNIERKLQLARSDRLSNLLSERFYSQPQGYLLQLQLRFQRHNATAGVFLTLLEGAHDQLLEWPFQRRFQLRVVDQQEGGGDISVEVDPRDPEVRGEACAGSFWRPFGRNDACGSSSAATYNQLYDRKFIRYGAILLKVVIFLEEIRPPRFATLTVRDRHLVARYEWRVPDLRSKIRQSKDVPFLDSDKFYLSNNGYRMMLRLYPEKAAGHAGLYAVLVRGEYDDELQWPFPHTFRLEVRTDPAGRIITRTTYPGESGSGCPDVAFRRPDRELAEWSCGEGRMVAHRTLDLSPEGAAGNFAVEVFLEEFPNPPVAALRVDPRGGALVSKYSWILKNAPGALELLRSGEKETMESPVFYTENQGYALRMSLSTGGSSHNADSKESIGLFWTLQRGQYDDALLWPFMGPVTLNFVDRNGVKHLEGTTGPDRGSCPPRAFERPKESRNEQSCGFPDLVSLSSLLSAFAFDGILHVQATVLLT